MRRARPGRARAGASTLAEACGEASIAEGGVALGRFVNAGVCWLAGAVGAGLVFAGASGLCVMANLLRLAPWNRIAA
ncbi:MAG: hypothetical protein BGP06_02555 [Rhizobiales bacterium 65-9]|nr:MAG: hypothetical protein BGP06_02555 [Rhizobiales bacterium 65-9]